MNLFRYFGVLLFAILHCTTLNAQEVIYSPYEKFDLRSGDFSVIGKVGSYTYTYRATNDGFFLDAYTDSMEKMATVVLDFFPKKIYETRFINYPDKILALYQAVESNRVVQYAALMDATGRLLKNPIKISEAKTSIFGPTKQYFSSAVSDDKKQIFVYAATDNRDELELTGIWLDDALTNTLTRTSTSFKADYDVAHGEGLLDNNGNFYLPLFTPSGNKSYSDKLVVLSLAKAQRHFGVNELPLDGRYATNTFMKLDNYNNRVYVGGFYADKKAGNYEGVLFAYYDIADSSFHNHKMIPFDEQLRLATGERSKKRAFNDYIVRQMIIKKDGGFVLISEDFFVTTRNTNPGFGGYYSSYYYGGSFGNQIIREYNYNDIFTLSYDGQGNREWHAFVRKNQYSQEDGGLFSSYAIMNTGGSIGFLFNDFNTNKSRIQFATVDANGSVDMRSLGAGNRDDPDWLPRSGKQIGLREMIIPCLHKRQISFAKIVF